MEDRKIGFAMCGSFCTFSKVMPIAGELVQMGCKVYPVMSETAYSTDTRFGKAEDFKNYLENILVFFLLVMSVLSRAAFPMFRMTLS